MKHIATVLVVMGLFTVLHAQSMPATAPAKLPVPAEKDVTAAMKTIKDKLSKEYSALLDARQQYLAALRANRSLATDAELRAWHAAFDFQRQLTTGLFKFTAPENAPAVCYAAKLLLIELDLMWPPDATPDLLSRGIVKLNNQYDLSGEAYAKLLVDFFTKYSPSAPHYGWSAFVALLAAQEMIDREQLEAAKTLAQIALKWTQIQKAAKPAPRTAKPDQIAIKDLDNIANEASLLLANIKEMEAACKKVRPLLGKLKTNPDDEAANTEVGTFLCYFKGDWKTGLPRMALGKDPALKAIAADDIRATNPADKIAVAQRWLEMASKSKGVMKAAMEDHYRNLYHAACSAVADGEKLKVDAKLDGGPQAQANIRKLAVGTWGFGGLLEADIWKLADDGTVSADRSHSSGTWSVDADTVTVRFGDITNRFQLPIDPNGVIIEDENGRFRGSAHKER